MADKLPAREPLPPINFTALAEALLCRVKTLVPAWMPGGTVAGHEYKCASLGGGAGSSCSVNIGGSEKLGCWADFATGEQGADLISLYAAINNLPNGKAALALAREEGLEDVAGVQRARAGTPPPKHEPKHEPKPAPSAAAPKSEPEGWQTQRPVPANAPKPTFKHQYRTSDTHQDKIDHLAEYRVGEDLHGYVVRFLTSTGDKETLPYTWCVSPKDGGCKWHWKTWDEPRPLYLPGHALPGGPTGRTVVLVEGEKKADALQAALDAGAPKVFAVCSWVGGCNAWKKADWSWLAGSHVLLWPDCDAKRVKLTRDEQKQYADPLARQVYQNSKPLLAAEKQPGMAAQLGIGALLRDAHGCTVQLLAIPAPGAVADGWDCGDAINTDGWDFARLQGLFATAYTLPADVAADAGSAGDGGGNKPPGGKKIDGLADAPGGDGDDDDSRMPDWLRPYYDAEKCRFMVSRKLVIDALTHDPKLKGVLGRNELSNNIDARQAWPWQHAKAGPITGAIDLLLGQYLTDRYGLPSIPRAALMEAVETVAHGRPFHPIRLMLDGLVWDGVERRNKWLLHVLGETPESLPAPVVEYLCLVGRYWLLGMVNRVMNPGCKFDYCPVLEGPGGLRKSTLVEVLAGSVYFSDTHFDVGRGKEGQEQVQGLWMYEIAELANFGKAEIGLIKAFITAKVDRYRPSYGRVVEAFERQCILVGTTNESTYLRDRTGNRRFWPVPVRHRIKTEWVEKWREQLLAEAYAMYLQGEPYTPGHQDEARLFVPMQESRLVETAVISEMLNVLTRTAVANGPASHVNCLTEFVTMAQMTMALGVDAAKSNAALETQIRSWFEHEGWERVKKQVNGTRAWGYARPAMWPAADPVEAVTALAPGPVSTAIKQFNAQDDDNTPF